MKRDSKANKVHVKLCWPPYTDTYCLKGYLGNRKYSAAQSKIRQNGQKLSLTWKVIPKWSFVP